MQHHKMVNFHAAKLTDITVTEWMNELGADFKACVVGLLWTEGLAASIKWYE